MKKRISALFLTLLLAFALCLPAAADSEMAYLFDVSDVLSYEDWETLEQQAQALSERVDVLSRRSIRDKLLCYFHQQAERNHGTSFTLPFSFSVLADYIATDRSAMMRELRHLKEEGLVQTEGRRVTLPGRSVGEKHLKS